MIKDALYAVTHGQDLSYDLAKDTMNKIMSGDVADVLWQVSCAPWRQRALL